MKSFVFGDRKRRLRVDANPKRIKKDAFSKISGYVWTGPKNPIAIQSVANAKGTRACKLVRKCLDNDICKNFPGYFELQQHKTQTRNSECLIRLLCIKTEYARKSFQFMGAKLYNELPVDLRKTESFKQYQELLKQHFS